MMSGWEAKEPQTTQSTCKPYAGRAITQQSINIDPTAVLPTLVHSAKAHFCTNQVRSGKEICLAW